MFIYDTFDSTVNNYCETIFLLSLTIIKICVWTGINKPS